MAIRVVRHLGARAVAGDDCTPLIVIPYGAGEALRHIRVDAEIITNADSEPHQPGQVDWLGLAVPWAVIFTSKSYLGSGGPSDLDASGDWDVIWRNLVFEYGNSGDEYYGGENTAAGGSEDDPIQAAKEMPKDDDHDQDDPIHNASGLGPIGIERLFSREVLMRPLLSDGSGECHFYDEFNLSLNHTTNHQSGGVIMLGAIRWEHEEETNFGLEMQGGGNREVMQALIGGDLSRVQAMITDDTTVYGDAIRTMLFGGDNYIENNTLKGDNAIAYMKSWVSFTTPYKIK